MLKTPLLTIGALAVLATPAAASEAGVPGTVAGTDRTLTAACHYTRTTNAMDGDRFELTGVATSAPDTDVSIRCTLTSSWGGGTAEGSGFNHAIASASGFVGFGPTTICVHARADRTVDVQMYVDECRTYAG